MAVEEATKPEKSGGILGNLKKVGLGALNLLDTGRAALVSAGVEGGDLIRYGIGKDKQNNASLGDFISQTKRHIGAGEVVENSQLLGDNKWAKRAVGGVLDIAADPLNAVTFGSGEVAKTGLAKAGQVLGDDVARQALREGGTEGLRKALLEAGSDLSLEDVLTRGTREGSGNVERTLADMDRTGKGGFGIGGYRTGLGQSASDSVLGGLRNSEVGKAIRPLFNTTAKVADEFGQGAASVTKNVISDAAQAKRLASREAASGVIEGLDEASTAAFNATPQGQRLDFIRDAADAAENTRQLARNPEIVSDAKGVYDAGIKAKINSAVVETLQEQAPELLSTVPGPGLVDLGNGFHVKQVVADALKGATSTPPGELLKGIDAATNVLKRYTTLGPLNAIPHVTRNIFSNMLFATMYGGVKGLKPWEEAGKYRSVLQDILKAGETVDLDSLAARGLKGNAATRALDLHTQGLVGRGGAVFDEVGQEAEKIGEAVAGKPKSKLRQVARKVSGDEGVVGTRTASRVNEWHEELSRGAVFLQGLDDGLTPSMASRKSRDAMLDYSQEGLTKFERDVLQRTLFFYKFPRRAVPAGIKFSIEHPGAVNAASKSGIGIDRGERNQFGDPIGLSFDTPLESTFGTLRDFAKNPVEAAIGMTNPVAQAALDKDKRGITDLLPPLGQGESRLGHLSEDRPNVGTALFAPGGGLLGPTPWPGGRVGVDYEAKAAKEKDEEARTKLPVSVRSYSPTQRLQAAAEKAGIESPYGKTKKVLLKEMAEAGVSKDMLTSILR